MLEDEDKLTEPHSVLNTSSHEASKSSKTAAKQNIDGTRNVTGFKILSQPQTVDKKSRESTETQAIRLTPNRNPQDPRKRRRLSENSK